MPFLFFNFKVLNFLGVILEEKLAFKNAKFVGGKRASEFIILCKILTF